MTSSPNPTADAEEYELKALLDEFVLYVDDTPYGNEPTELSVFLQQCDYPDAMDRLHKELQEHITTNYVPREQVEQLAQEKYFEMTEGKVWMSRERFEKEKLEAQIESLTSLPDDQDQNYVSVEYIMYRAGKYEDRLAELKSYMHPNQSTSKEKQS